jgi:uncharacterized membrane protein YbhN (UPF0104 family)
MLRRWLTFAAKIAISTALVWLLLDRVEIGPMSERLGRLSSGPILLAGLLLSAQIPLASQRWRFVMDALGAPLAYWPTLRIYLVGIFFNQTLPSTLGGDAIRVWLTGRLGVALGRALTGVLLDRVSGLLVILLVILVSLPVSIPMVADPVARWSLVLVTGTGLMGFGALFFVPGLLSPLFDRWRPTRAILALSDDARRLFLTPGSAARIFALSFLVLLISALAIYNLGWAIGVDLGILNCLILTPPIIVVAFVPISVAGWGVREGAMVVAFGYVGVPAADALVVSILFGLSLIVIGLPGGLLWLTSGRREERASVAGAGRERGEKS